MQQELTRAQTSLAKTEPAPYYISYSVFDQESVEISAAQGSLLNSMSSQRRSADVTMRVGTPALDNTHGPGRESGIASGPLPISDDKDALAHSLWLLTNAEYRQAVPAFLNLKTAAAVQSAEEDKSPDFSTETAHQDVRVAGPGDSDPAEGMGRSREGLFGGFRQVSPHLQFRCRDYLQSKYGIYGGQ